RHAGLQSCRQRQSSNRPIREDLFRTEIRTPRRRERDEAVHFGALGEALESLRRDANDARGHAVETDDGADDRRITAEVAAPVRVTEDDDGLAAGSLAF